MLPRYKYSAQMVSAPLLCWDAISPGNDITSGHNGTHWVGQGFSFHSLAYRWWCWGKSEMLLLYIQRTIYHRRSSPRLQSWGHCVPWLIANYPENGLRSALVETLMRRNVEWWAPLQVVNWSLDIADPPAAHISTAIRVESQIICFTFLKLYWQRFFCHC